MWQAHCVEYQEVTGLAEQRSLRASVVSVLERSRLLVDIGQIEHAPYNTWRAAVLMPGLWTDAGGRVGQRFHQPTIGDRCWAAQNTEKKRLEIGPADQLLQVRG